MKPLITILCFVFVAALPVYRVARADVPTAQRDALIGLYTGAGGNSWTYQTNWKEAAGTECDWYGVTCNTDQTTVVAIDLSTNNLSGRIPDSIGDLTGLTQLSLSGNHLNGEIPDSIQNLTQLQYLALDDNALSGGIPAGLYDLTALTYLSLSKNQLAGILSSRIGYLENLTILLLSENQLQGAIPEEIKLLTSLIDERSDFRYNDFSTDGSDALKTFLSQKQIGGDWQTSQGQEPAGTTAAQEDNTSSCFIQALR